MAKISYFIIMMIVFSAIIAGGWISFMASISENYNPNDFNETKLETYNKLAELKEQSDDIENKTTSLQGSNAGVTDILGGFFEAGYNAMALSFSSFSIFEDMATSAKEDIPNMDKIEIYFTAAVLIVTIILVFIILKIVLKGDL